jgi:hypothetical protein
MKRPIHKAGDTVVLNDKGLENIFGSSVGKSHMKTLEMKLTFVDPTSMTAPEPSHVVEVDNEEINQFLLHHWCFDVVRSA